MVFVSVPYYDRLPNEIVIELVLAMGLPIRANGFNIGTSAVY